MINKWLTLGMIFWRVENVTEHLFEELEVRPIWVVESGVEGEQGAAEAETVACEFELAQGLDLLDKELECGTVGRLGQPHVKIRNLVVPLLKIYEIVARPIMTKLINLIFHILPFNLRFLLRMRNQQAQIFNYLFEMTFNTSLSDHQDSLSVFPFL